MATGICSCDAPTFPSMGRPNCVIEMRTMAFPIIFPRYKADGITRNEIDVTSATIGADIQALLLATVDAESRLYPFPRIEEPTWERSDSVTEDAPSGRSYRIFGQGGVYTLAFKTYAKDAVAPLLKQAERLGCSDFDFFYVSVDGNLWGELEGTKLRGYKANSDSYDTFKEFATDSTVEKLNVMWDLDQDVALGNSYAITAEELGYKATTLTGNITATQTLASVSDVLISDLVSDAFGTANNAGNVTGLVTGDFTVTNTTPSTPVVLSVTVTEPIAGSGNYNIALPAQTAGDVIQVEIAKAGYDVALKTVVAL